jgi:protein SCO1/2
VAAGLLISSAIHAEEASMDHGNMPMQDMKMDDHDHMIMDADAKGIEAKGNDGHAAHQHMMHDIGTKQPIKHTTMNYSIPSVKLIRSDGKPVELIQELDDGRPVILNFIYTTCTEICPLTSMTFSKFQDLLEGEVSKVHMMSVSIDPEQDTPAVLKKYAEKFNAMPQWNFYTGTTIASVVTQKAFDAYLGDKMNHVPVTYLRSAPGKPWVRIDGFVSPEELLQDYKGLISSK